MKTLRNLIFGNLYTQNLFTKPKIETWLPFCKAEYKNWDIHWFWLIFPMTTTKVEKHFDAKLKRYDIFCNERVYFDVYAYTVLTKHLCCAAEVTHPIKVT